MPIDMNLPGKLVRRSSPQNLIRARCNFSGTFEVRKDRSVVRRKQYTEAQIGFAQRQAEKGTVVTEICQRMKVTQPTFYHWKRNFSGCASMVGR
jgi:putative transposase